MEVISYSYERQRREFGGKAKFDDCLHQAEVIPANPADASQWRKKVIRTIELDCTPSLSMHTVRYHVIMILLIAI